MAAIPVTPAKKKADAARWLQAAGACGATLALAILGASVMLRLTTLLGADGHVISTLSPAMEGAIRMIHRISASGVGLLAAGIVFIAWTRRPLPAPVFRSIWLICVATVLLAVIGPLTTGYRLPSVTVGNVAGGVILLMGFWWIRELAATKASARRRASPLLQAAICVFLAHVAIGAAASAHAMRGVHGFALLHLGTALLATMFMVASARAHAKDHPRSALPVALSCLLAAQLLLGLILLAAGSRPVSLGFAHAMFSPLMALTLVSMAVRNQHISQGDGSRQAQ